MRLMKEENSNIKHQNEELKQTEVEVMILVNNIN